MTLLPNEQEAADFVTCIGLNRARRVLDALTRRIERRYQAACDESPYPLNPEWVRRTPLEVDLTFRIKLGMSLVDDFFTPTAARRRLEERIAKRRAEDKARRAAKLA